MPIDGMREWKIGCLFSKLSENCVSRIPRQKGLFVQKKKEVSMKRIVIACSDDPKMCKRMVVTDAGYYCDIISGKCFSQYEPPDRRKESQNCETKRGNEAI
jgi:hypothetical protein